MNFGVLCLQAWVFIVMDVLRTFVKIIIKRNSFTHNICYKLLWHLIINLKSMQKKVVILFIIK